jgi:hypothetical protein
MTSNLSNQLTCVKGINPLIKVENEYVQGKFCWLEKPLIQSDNIFSVIFEYGAWHHYMRRLDINAENGEIIGICEAR